uniref:DUF4132 domain-containing protein n=1 Tax=Thaumasiovibrio occultus TaxID=1891184 RepID=UPI000B35A9F6|nr:DUF4132 domain-containing protein [Thaumasiovibrio occultus]
MSSADTSSSQTLSSRTLTSDIATLKPTIKLAFAAFGKLQTGLDMAIANYIATGEDENCLAAIEGLSEQDKLLSGRSHGQFWMCELPAGYKIRREEIGKAFYALVSAPMMADLALVRRLTDVLVAAKNDDQFKTRHDIATPTRFDVLMCHLGHAVQDYNNMHFAIPGESFQYLTTDWLRAVAEAEDVDAVQLYRSLLSGEDPEEVVFFANNYQVQFHIGAWHYIATHTDWSQEVGQASFDEAFPALSDKAKQFLMQQLVECDDLSFATPYLIAGAIGSHKGTLKAALNLAPKADGEGIGTLLANQYATLSHHQRRKAVQFMARLTNGVSQAVELFTTWQATEKNQAVSAEIDTALQNTTFAKLAKAAQTSASKKNSNAIDNGAEDPTKALTIPSYVPIARHQPLSNALLTAFWAAYEARIAQLTHDVENAGSDAKDQLAFIKRTSRDSIDDALNYLATGEGDASQAAIEIIRMLDISEPWSFVQWERLTLAHSYDVTDALDMLVDDATFCATLASYTEITDLRQLFDYYATPNSKPSDNVIARLLFSDGYIRDHDRLARAFSHLAVWPLLVEYPTLLDGVLLGGTSSIAHQSLALKLLRDFPALPHQYSELLYDIALSDKKTLRPLAQALLIQFGLDHTRVIEQLKSKKSEQRLQAANWLKTQADPAAIKPLAAAVKKEKQELVKAALLSALNTLGEDISTYLTPANLLAEAKAGLSKSLPKSMAWFPLDSLPTLQFQNGETVAQEIPQWWVVLAVKLKLPAGNALLQQYLSLLAKESQHTFSRFVFEAFVAFDTECPSDEEAHQHAKQWMATYNPNPTYINGIQVASGSNEDAESLYQSFFKEKKRDYRNSAIKDKGLLCLMHGLPASDARNLVATYMKAHPLKRHQIEAMLEALASRDEKVIVQFILSIARRYKTQTVQERAQQLVLDIAARNQWTAQTLGDRTIPACGFSEVGKQASLTYGQRHLSLKLTDALKIELLNEEGNPLKALPQPREADNASDIKEAKSWFNNCKKELRLVVKQQPLRLSEAMYFNRVWPAGDWFADLYQHPVMNTLLQRVVWQVNIDGKAVYVRPAEDGSFLTVDDDELDISQAQTVQIATVNTLSKSDLKRWKAHFKQYKLKPLLEQFELPKLDLTEIANDAVQFDHYDGQLCDSHTLDNTLTKLGYERGIIRDKGRFYDYTKAFAESGYRAVFTFSGNIVQKEQITVAIHHIALIETGENSYDDPLRLDQLPASIVNALALDYEKVAAKCTFDPNWRSKLNKI